MRNLKKILALVLALIMSMSLMVTANAFEDDADIDPTFDEAVTVLSNLGVFTGYEDETFRPEKTIKRNEVAAIIYRIVTGDVNDKQVGIYADYDKFSDVKSTAWYAGYVNFCANAEYIKGYPDGTFKPEATVTGYQALAMILRAVGYDKNHEFEGAGWQVQTAAVANKLGVTDNVAAGLLGQPATREIVAEILFRSILVPQVTYTVAFGYQDGQNLGLDSDAKNPSIGYETFGLEKTVGEITAVGYQAGTTTFTEIVEDTTGWWNSKVINDNALGSSVIVADTDANWENIGYVGYAYTVKTASAKTRSAVSDVTLTGDSLHVSTNGTSFEYLENNVISLDEDDDTNVRYYLNGEVVEKKDVLAHDKQVGVKLDFIDNDNSGKIEVVVATHYTVAEVTGIATDINAGSNAIKKNNYYLDNLNVAGREVVGVKHMVCADELAMGDLVTYVEYRDDYYTVVAPLTTATLDQITREKVEDSDTKNIIYTIGDADYITANDFDVYNVNSALIKANLDKSMDIFTDPYGYILTANLTTYASNFLYVLANEDTSVKAGVTEAQVAFVDGNIDWVNVASVDGDKYFEDSFRSDKDEDIIEQHIYKYTLDKNDNYVLTSADCDELYNIYYTNGKAPFNGNAVKGDDETSLKFGLNKASVIVDLRPAYAGTVYTGYAEVPSLSDATVHYLAPNGIVTLAYLVAGDNSADLSANFVVFNTDVNRVKVANGVYAYYLDVLVDGELVEDYELSEKQYDDIADTGVGHYIYNAKGILDYTSFAEEWYDVNWSKGTLTVYEDDGSIKAYVEYDEVPFNVLTIKDGTVDGYKMMNGLDDDEVKAYITYNNNGSVKEIYVIAEGEDALATQRHTPCVYNLKNLTYFAEDYCVTAFKEIPVIAKTVNGVSVVAADGVTAVTTPAIGDVLTANIVTSTGVIGSYPVNADAKYTWHYAGSDAVLGTAATYTVTADNAGKVLVVDVEVEGYTGTAYWTASAPIASIPDAVTGVSVVGADGVTEIIAPFAGDVLTANIETNTGVIGSYPVNAAAKYTWHYAGSDAVLGTAATYTVTADNAGKVLVVDVEVEGYIGTATWTSAEIAMHKITGVSVVDGTDGVTEVTAPVVGQKLVANIETTAGVIGSYPVNADAHYTWFYAGSDTVLGTSATYTVTSDNIGKTICLKVTVDTCDGTQAWIASATVA